MYSVKTFSILIWINAHRAKNDLAEIFARITINQKRTNISLKQKIDISKWDSSKSKAKGNSQEARLLNQFLEKERTKISKAYQELEYVSS